jgi:hypothetical protein
MQRQLKIKFIRARNYESSHDVIGLLEWRQRSMRFFFGAGMMCVSGSFSCINLASDIHQTPENFAVKFLTQWNPKGYLSNVY